MNCPSCQHENPESDRFCGGCGTALERVCASCAQRNPPGHRFCGGCGNPLDASSAAPERDPRSYTPKHLADKILQSKSALEGERKQVTVMFADVKGSMELAEQLDPEQWHGILDRFFEILSGGVHRFEGTVNQYLGDGIMALFGAPLAHEDHAQRACYSALHLLEELRGYTLELRREHGLDFAVRIGLNSGHVVVGKIGDDLRMDYTAQGQAVGLAQRMESLAEPNSCVLSEETRGLVSGYFDLEDLGVFSVKGVADPLRAFALRGVGAARTRLDLARTRGFTKFVGRDREMQSLDSALEQALEGNGQVVGVVAEAGTGKSRICLEFVQRCRARGLRVNEAHCPAHGKTVAYLPVLEMLRDIFDIGDRDSNHEARRKIAGELLLLDNSFQELLPLVFEFLGVPDPDRPAPDLPAEGRRRQLMAFVRHLTEAQARREPGVLLLDDLHWIDPGSDAFLAQAIEAAQSTRTLILVNFRPEYQADWMNRSYYRQLPLSPLGRAAVDELLLDLIGVDPSLAELPQRIHERTGGNPFFVEEVVQALIEGGELEGARGSYRLVAPVESLKIPATVQNVLAARIDRLPEREKRILQTAAVIGKEFPESILKRVAELPDTELAQGMSALLQAEFVFEKSLYPDVEYAFKHPLTHEIAYGSQLSQRRAGVHAAVAKAIEEVDADRLDERSSLLAHHWDQAGDAEMAARWHRRAALRCASDSPADALRHWRRVYELTRAAREFPDATALRIEAAIGILNLGWRQGRAEEDDADEVFRAASDLAATSGDARQQLLLLLNRSNHFTLGGRPELSRPLAERALALTEGVADPELHYLAQDLIMNFCIYRGELREGLSALERRIEATFEAGVSIDALGCPAQFFVVYRGHVLTLLGRQDEASGLIEPAVAQLRELGELQGLSWGHAFSADHYFCAGEWTDALAHGRRAVELAEQVASGLALVMAHEFYGAALLGSGEAGEAASHLERAVDVAQRTSAFLSREAHMLALLSEARLASGSVECALKTADDAVAAGLERQTPAFEARAHLARARILLADDATGSEASLRRCNALIESTGARVYIPHVHETRARLAHRAGDEAAFERELREAQRLHTEMGATGHAARLAQELEALPS